MVITSDILRREAEKLINDHHFWPPYPAVLIQPIALNAYIVTTHHQMLSNKKAPTGNLVITHYHRGI